MRFGLVVPILNAGKTAGMLLDSIKGQTARPDDFLVIDSCSTDGSPITFSVAGAHVRKITREDFNHGGTRQMAVDMLPEADIILFLTQDAIPADSGAFAALLDCFEDETVGAAFGRQIPRIGAGPIEVHARLFNYPAKSRVKNLTDIPELGIKAAFISNSFSAYRRPVLQEIGGFPRNVILSEDTFVAAKMLLAGWRVAYCAEAVVFHSHNYRPVEEMKRYFDLGVLHSRESWILRTFGKAEGEGLRFVRSEFRYLLKESPWLIPSAVFRAALKIVGYRMGLAEHLLPISLKTWFSMNKRYWL